MSWVDSRGLWPRVKQKNANENLVRETVFRLFADGQLFRTLLSGRRVAEMLVDVGRHTFGVAVLVFVLLVLPVGMHDVHGVPVLVRVDVDLRLGLTATVMLFAAGHVPAALSIHVVHKRSPLTGDCARLSLLVFFGLVFLAAGRLIAGR